MKGVKLYSGWLFAPFYTGTIALPWLDSIRSELRNGPESTRLSYI
jgi:hypothetical protein